MPNLIDLTGKRFGKLTVLSRTQNQGHFVAWLCRCDCGNILAVRGQSLKSGNTKSCGCIVHKHNGSKTRLYTVWVRMMERCYKPRVARYANYGGRGIKVCDAWHDFGTFREWAMNSGYDEEAAHYECTLDRIDVNGNYCPENCRWIPMSEQAHNTTRNHILFVDGERMDIAQASEKYGISVATLWARLKSGYDDETAVKAPLYRIRREKCRKDLAAV